jgi:hypothetical protein
MSLGSKKKEELHPSSLAKADQLASHAPNKGLIELLKYFFELPLEGLSELKPHLVDAVEDHLNSFHEQRFEA